MTGGAIMLQGTGSDVGKSVLAAGLARALDRRGLRVRPFKPQNMSNNAAVTPDGGEIGRAQALQARACRVAPSVDMNPVLLKPQSGVGAQVVVHGRVVGNASAREYQHLKATLMPKVVESFERLRAQADVVVVEGAGSASEVNLRAGDIANMGFATAARVPVVLVGDIDRGGVIASLVGACVLLEPGERALVAGYLINKLRGDPSLFDDGVAAIGERTGFDCLGVVPWLDAVRRLPAEDSVALEHPRARSGARRIRIAVPALPRISNFDDLDPLAAEPDVECDFVARGRALPGDADLVVLPGSKSTVADLEALREEGWDVDIAAHVRRGGHLVGLCGGFQMLGRSVADPRGVEGTAREIEGLGLLDVETRIEGAKTLAEREGAEIESGAPVRGYEMHSGDTRGPALARPWLRIGGAPHGAVSADGRVRGAYLHGLFANDRFRSAFLARLAERGASGVAYEARVEDALDALAAHVETHVHVDRVIEIATAPGGRAAARA